MIERRVCNRYNSQMRVTYRSDKAYHNRGLATNLSHDGVFISTLDPLPPGDYLTVSLGLDVGKKISVQGQVMRKSYDGMGVRFIHTGQSSTELLALLPEQ